MRRVSVHIDRLVLHGLVGGARDDFAEGLQQELARVLADPQTLRRLIARGNAPRLRAEKVSMRTGSPPGAVGAQVAQAIGKALR